jgi:hypothetical protein
MFARIIDSFGWRAELPSAACVLPGVQFWQERSNADQPVARGTEVPEKLIVLDYHSARN